MTGAPSIRPEKIETDPQDETREYIPLPGGWEVQTKGHGSSYRLLDKKTGVRKLILCADAAHTQEFVTRMAKEVFAAVESLKAERDAARERLQAIIDWADLALANPAEFNPHGVRNLDGPVFDAARAFLTAQEESDNG